MRLTLLDTRDMDDEGEAWEKWIIEEACGLDNSSELTMRILESHLEEILIYLEDLRRIRIRDYPDKADAYDASFALGYQVVALFLLEIGSYVPDKVKQEVLRSTTWEFDKRWWQSSDSNESRKEFLKKLREAVKNQVPGKKYKF